MHFAVQMVIRYVNFVTDEGEGMTKRTKNDKVTNHFLTAILFVFKLKIHQRLPLK